jgi:transposase
MRASSFQPKKKSRPECLSTQGDLFNHDVLSHVMANATSLCHNTLGESKRHMMEAREIRGLEIARNAKVTRVDNLFIIPSQSISKKYAVDLDQNPPVCTCADFETNRQQCKHIFAAQFLLRQDKESLPEPPQIARPTYRQDWRSYRLAQVNEKSQFLALLYELCQGIEEPIQEKGRPRLPLADIIFAATFRIYSTLSGRRFMSDLRDALQRGYLSRLPSYNSIFDYLQMKSLTPYITQLIELSSLPLKSVETAFAVDSSGFSTCRFTRWYDVKYGKDEDWREWIKLHLICGVKTHIVTGVEVSEAYANDYTYFQPLVEQTARNGFQMKEVSADKAYLGVSNFAAALKQGAIPYIPFKSNSQPNGNGALWARIYHFYNFQRAEFLQHYHQRSNSESVFSMIKAKFGERLRCKTEQAQFNEALCKVLAHNLCCVIQSMYELGIDATFRTESEPVRNVS